MRFLCCGRDYIFLAHHAGGHDRNDIVYQMEKSFENMAKTLESVGATLDDLVQTTTACSLLQAGYAVKEYIRQRRISSAVKNIKRMDCSILDIALKYVAADHQWLEEHLHFNDEFEIPGVWIYTCLLLQKRA